MDKVLKASSLGKGCVGFCKMLEV